jgi:NAD(P)-dependent dehydrogenase (short-subunit alcohol dehydrogenase family)
MPLLEQAPAGRVLTLTSGARAQGHTLSQDIVRPNGSYDAWRAYGDSKLANYQFGIELARRLEAAGSTVSSLVAHPGFANTNLQHATHANAGGGIAGSFFHWTVPLLGMSQERGALPGLRAATDPDAQNGDFYGPRWNIRGAPVKLGPEEKHSAPADTARMWNISEAETGTVFSLGN